MEAIKGLTYKPDNIAKDIKDVLGLYPKGHLPDVFNTDIPMLQPKRATSIKTLVKMSALRSGAYQTSSSSSDKLVADGLKTILKHPYLSQYSDTDDLTELVKDARKMLYVVLHNGQTKKHAHQTIKNNIKFAMRLLYIAYNKDIKSNKPPIYIVFQRLMTALGDKISLQEDTNTRSALEKQRHVDWGKVLKKQQQISVVYGEIANKNTQRAYEVSQDLLLISLYSLTPPLRREGFELEFGDHQPYALIKTIDYVYFNPGGFAVIVLNKDKKRHGRTSINLSPELTSILSQSYQQYPRTFLFTNIDAYPDLSIRADGNAVNNRLKSLTGMSVNAMRSSYVSHQFTTQMPSMTDIKTMADALRTSTDQVLTYYRKIDDDTGVDDAGAEIEDYVVRDDTETGSADVEAGVEAGDSYERANLHLVHKYQNSSLYRDRMLAQQREYREKLGPFEIRRRKIISMLKNSPTYANAIKSSTRAKYGL